MGAWFGKVLAWFGVELVERLMGPLIAWAQRKIAEMQKKKEDRAETAEVLEGTKNAETEAERIEAARRSARNGG